MGGRRPGKALYTISTVAQRYSIHPQTLRLYEREGLLAPSRTEGNTRMYSDEDLERLETILSLTRDLGVNLAGVEIILRLLDDMEALKSDFEQQMAEYVTEVEARLQQVMANSTAPVRRDEPLLPVPRLHLDRKPRV